MVARKICFVIFFSVKKKDRSILDYFLGRDTTWQDRERTPLIPCHHRRQNSWHPVEILTWIGHFIGSLSSDSEVSHFETLPIYFFSWNVFPLDRRCFNIVSMGILSHSIKKKFLKIVLISRMSISW